MSTGSDNLLHLAIRQLLLAKDDREGHAVDLGSLELYRLVVSI